MYSDLSDKLEVTSPFVPSTHQLYKWLFEAVVLPERVVVNHPAGLGKGSKCPKRYLRMENHMALVVLFSNSTVLRVFGKTTTNGQKRPLSTVTHHKYQQLRN